MTFFTLNVHYQWKVPLAFQLHTKLLTLLLQHQRSFPHCLSGWIANTPFYPLCRKVPGMHSSLWMECRVDCLLCRWRRRHCGSGEGMETSIRCEDCNEALYFTPKRNCFYEFHHICSIFMYSGGIWPDCGCVMSILKAKPSVGRNPVTSKGILILI
jgi:hypothetical protein